MSNNFTNIIIAGAPKSGTTSLFEYLASHPDICASNKKETRYFLPIKFGETPEPITEYEKFFSHYNGEPFRLEATANYLYGGEKLPEAISNTLNDARIIFLLREPVSRVFSLYNYYHSTLLTIPSNMTFEEYVSRSFEQMDLMEKENVENWYSRGVKGGRYAEFLNDWYKYFDQEKIRIYFFDDLKNNPGNVVAEIYDWLNIDQKSVSLNSFKTENKTVAYRGKSFLKILQRINRMIMPFIPVSHRSIKKFNRKIKSVFVSNQKQQMLPASKKMLQEYYKPFNQSLWHLMKAKGYKKFPDWLN